MPEGVVRYPRFAGPRDPTARWRVLAAHEFDVALRGRWSLLALGAGIAWGLASVIELVQVRETADVAFVRDAFLAMLGQLRWAAVAIGVVIGAPMVLDDVRAGALELYLTRGLDRAGYLAGKAAALVALSSGAMAAAALLYYLASLAFYDSLPASWHADAAYGLLYCLLWGLLVAGVALGASCALRSTAGAIILVAGVFFGLDLFVRRLLGALTENERLAVASPFAAFDQAATWMWDLPPEHGFPAWWGAVAWALLAGLGWALAVWRLPRPKGEVA